MCGWVTSRTASAANAAPPATASAPVVRALRMPFRLFRVLRNMVSPFGLSCTGARCMGSVAFSAAVDGDVAGVRGHVDGVPGALGDGDACDRLVAIARACCDGVGAVGNCDVDSAFVGRGTGVLRCSGEVAGEVAFVVGGDG